MSFGTQVGTLWTPSGPKLDPYFRRVSGRTAVMHAVARRLVTPSGSLSWDRRVGFDVRRWLNAAVTDKALSHIQTQVKAQCLLDERVDAAAVTATFDLATSTLSIAIELTLADEGESFAFVFAASQLSTELLAA
jgi:hypothetical protein